MSRSLIREIRSPADVLLGRQRVDEVLREFKVPIEYQPHVRCMVMIVWGNDTDDPMVDQRIDNVLDSIPLDDQDLVIDRLNASYSVLLDEMDLPVFPDMRHQH